jgi:hypothetical protein
MKKIVVATLLLTLSISSLLAWGFHAHKRIHELAVLILPAPLFSFYKNHIDYVSKHAVDADKRRYVNPDEAAFHYIDLDHYGKFAFDSLPAKWEDAVKKYSEDSLKKYGIVPWHIERMKYRLTEAFKNEDEKAILYLSANIGHYIADAHVPLHTTQNYNGQLTHQHGIHALWETRLPELFSKDWNFFTGKAVYIHDVNKEIWKIIRESFVATDSVLKLEQHLNDSFPSDGKYTYVSKGKTTKKNYSENYAQAYNILLNGMVERRMRKAVMAVGSFWYTAWVDAGKPNLDYIANVAMNDSMLQKIRTTHADSIQTIKGHVE